MIRLKGDHRMNRFPIALLVIALVGFGCQQDNKQPRQKRHRATTTSPVVNDKVEATPTPPKDAQPAPAKNAAESNTKTAPPAPAAPAAGTSAQQPANQPKRA